MRRIILTSCLALSFAHGAFASITITSSQMQVESKGMLNSSLLITGNMPWDFTGQAYLGLNSIDEIAVTLTLLDADTGAGEFDEGELMLELDGLNTGLALDGFADDVTMISYSVSGDNQADGLLNLLQQDGLLLGRVLDLSPNDNYIKIRGDYLATLSLTDHERFAVSVVEVPAPSALLLSSFGAVAASWLKRKRQRPEFAV
ncbi:MAG: PEP-CTERM sorting domain-containing protein [Planctomycetes bacterium]|nr:PEP-CTERM sorting domain-containing protein [Planctomycetota bacterium]